MADEMDDQISDWYRDAYPTDTEMADEMEAKGATFNDLWRDLNLGRDIYKTIGADDSIVRERVFQHLSELTGKQYRTIYKMWLASESVEKNNMYNEHLDDPRDWSASEGEVEIMWDTDDYEDFGIFRGEGSTYLVDYDRVDTHDDLINEVCRMIGKEYPDLDFEPYDFIIVNENEFWEQRGGDPGKLDEIYSEGKFETMADIDDEQIWNDVGIDDNDNVVEGIPNWATCYIMYGDDSGLTLEDVAMADKFVKDLEKDGLRLSHPISGSENEFNSYPAFGDACDTTDWSCESI